VPMKHNTGVGLEAGSDLFNGCTEGDSLAGL
jgi:hypothetical protein